MPRKPKERASRAATLHDVAAQVGVSAITVSRALNTPERVSEAVRERILAAVDALGYVPNRSARTLVSSRSQTVVVLIPSLSNTVFIDTLAGINDVLDPHHYQILIGNTGYDDAREERLLRTYLSHAPDGILLTGLRQSDGMRTWLDKLHIPVVHMMGLDPQAQRYCVGFSQQAAGAALTQHLLQRGYRNVAFFGARLDERVMQRAAGYRQALQEAGIYREDLEWLTPEHSGIGLGASMIAKALQQRPEIDAVFCCNDDLALGVLTYCQRNGIAVPQRLAVAGFNDLDGAAWATPTLTTIRTPRYDIGHAAASMLLDLMSGNTPAEPMQDLSFTLQAREST
ncbi:LacI family DNA-binding transcriptional regulator [Amantichitinum ursilacus]|uniref:HTH-type transcriptional regulator GntR n=1 Tax=Amantichitinum ursilacus TaxID=857265 RepID=A0A0N0XJ65_9NEIS|nr:LacI family DNA-binding transcriptional regulator [Amantichitinum ursilacus]KPC53320.1 HTH-type transcriptional regulator GntR [Amantichitinum ursilacus]